MLHYNTSAVEPCFTDTCLTGKPALSDFQLSVESSQAITLVLVLVF